MTTFLQPLSKEEESLCIQALQDEDAHKYAGSEESMEDLISIGCIGLIKAVDSFDPSRNNRLAAYAARCIDNAILSQMRLWFQTNLPRAEKNQNGVFWHRFPRIYISFVPLRTAM